MKICSKDFVDIIKYLLTTFLELTDAKHAPLSKEEAKKKMMMSKQMDFICDLIDMIQPNNSKENSDNEN